MRRAAGEVFLRRSKFATLIVITGTSGAFLAHFDAAEAGAIPFPPSGWTGIWLLCGQSGADGPLKWGMLD
ncbi:hypothetical protein GCM10023158_08530 [Gluconacetobacter tumulicola]